MRRLFLIGFLLLLAVSLFALNMQPFKIPVNFLGLYHATSYTQDGKNWQPSENQVILQVQPDRVIIEETYIFDKVAIDVDTNMVYIIFKNSPVAWVVIKINERSFEVIFLDLRTMQPKIAVIFEKK